jgi:hypothetical protein
MEKRSNLLYAYDARDHKLVSFLWSDVRTTGQRAYRSKEVAVLLGCAPLTVRNYGWRGTTPEPQRWYARLDNDNPPGLGHNYGQRWFSPDHIRQMREAMSEVHIGRPNSEGIIAPRETLPTAEELEQRLENNDVLYEKVGDEFIPVWKAKF